MRLIVTILGVLFLSVGVFGQAFDEDEPSPEKKAAPKAVIQEKKVEVNAPAETPKPAEVVKPAEPAKATETVKPAESVKAPEAVKPAEPVKATETVKPAEPVKTPEAVKPAEPVKATETVKPAEPVKTPQAVKPAEPVKATETVKPAEPVKTPEAAKPSEAVKQGESARPAAAKPEADAVILSETVCAVSGASIKVTEKTPSSEYHGVRYYFVDEAKKREFDKNQWKFTKDIVTCQVCGKQDKIRGRGRNTFPDARYEGRNYFFCSNAHKSMFEASPMQYIDADKMYLRSVLKKPVEDKKKKAAEPAADTTKEK